MNLLKRRKSAKGNTLIEVLLVVGLVAVFAAGVYYIYNKVVTYISSTSESRNLDAIRAGVKSLYTGQSVYTGVTNTVLNNSRVTPDSMRAIPYVADDANINNSFGGTVKVDVSQLGSSTLNNGFYIEYQKVPGAVCPKLVTQAGNGFDQVTVAGTVVKTFGTNSLDIPTLAQKCATDSGNGITIKFESL